MNPLKNFNLNSILTCNIDKCRFMKSISLKIRKRCIVSLIICLLFVQVLLVAVMYVICIIYAISVSLSSLQSL